MSSASTSADRLTLPEACMELGLSYATLYRLVLSGKIESVRDRRLFVTRAGVDRFRQEHEQQTAGRTPREIRGA